MNTDELPARLFQVVEKVVLPASQTVRPEKYAIYEDCDLWENRMRTYIELLDEGSRPATILLFLDYEVLTVARVANITSTLTTVTILDRLRREFGRTLTPWVARKLIKYRRQMAGESVGQYQRHLCAFACTAYVDASFGELLSRILKIFIDGVATSEVKPNSHVATQHSSSWTPNSPDKRNLASLPGHNPKGPHRCSSIPDQQPFCS
ncbi:unnamed protein product [Dibothriocephalus latus]|uniref:Uncharacterized protein n=1 Tax=Dibothriocephalus latus TaxID=60516 RepID=A0A3P7NI37_DIBLA|nr:unnamed protein product [Dibothriocephalus latus]